jgi:hypothetical protein
LYRIRRVPETFWDGLAKTIEAAGPALRPDITNLLRTYIRRNGFYRFEPLLARCGDPRVIRPKPLDGLPT